MHRILIGITGASGIIYGVRLLQVLAAKGDVETHLVISESGEKLIRDETNLSPEQVRKMATFSYEANDIGARIASGSFKRDAMVIAPCSIKTMAALANSYNDNLIIRAGDVTLKEKKPLLLMVRETPLHLGHLRSMVALAEMGAIIMPPVPSFYSQPATIDDIVNQTVGRVLDLLGLDNDLVKRWNGLHGIFQHAE